MKINTLFFILSVSFILLLVGCSSSPKACTKEAKLCSDGSSVERTGPNCEFSTCPEPKVCTQETKICPDGSISERIGPNCEFRACPAEGKLVTNACIADNRGKSCPEDYTPVCGWFNQSIQCIKYPCATTYSNSCEACNDLKIDYWTEGPCPKTNAEMQSICQNAGGNWLAESRECEGVSKEQCSLMDGEFNECASACRNNSTAEMCTLQCVVVCQFKR